jgi:predicted DNA-binding protein (MmcQ/YjbR family)
MNLQQLLDYCQSKKEAYIDFPFGDIPICFKIFNKLFAEIYPKDYDFKITLKCNPDLALIYREKYPDVVVRGYYCPATIQKYRNTVYINKTVSDDLIFKMIDHSYDEVVKGLKRELRDKILNNN